MKTAQHRSRRPPASIDGPIGRQHHIKGLFDAELKNTTMLSAFGPRPGLATYYTRTRQLVIGREGAQLRLKPPVAPPPPPRGLL